MTSPREIIVIMKKLKISRYVYEIKFKGMTVKYGMSDAETTYPGERLYRQIGHLESWGNQKINGPNGSEFEEISHNFYVKNNLKLDHNDITVSIWNFDNYTFKTTNPTMEINIAEEYLIKNYEKIYNEKPIGNIDDGTSFKKRSAPLAHVWGVFFDE
jgi:hypothetical protein